MKEKPYRTVDDVIEEIKGIPIEELREYREDGKYLITRDELLAAGALYVPPAWRKSLSAGCDQKSDRQYSLFGEDDLLEDQQSASGSADDEREN